MASAARKNTAGLRTNGRPKGIPNKTTRLAKEAIAAAAEKLGGSDRLVEWAQEAPENEKVFWSTIYTKLIPVQTEITGKDGAAIQYEEKVSEAAHAFRSRLLSSALAGAASGATGDTVG